MQFSQFSLQAITETQARLGAGLLGFFGAVATSKTENPTLIFTTGAVVFVLGYMHLKKYTPAFRLNEAKNILDQIAHNKLANGFSEMSEDTEAEVKKPERINTHEYPDEYDTMLVKKITALYPFVIDISPYPLVTAMQELAIVQKNITQVKQLLDAAKPEIPSLVNVNKANPNELWSPYAVANQRLQHFTNNSSAALSKISLMKEFKKQYQEFQGWQNQREQLKIEQQKANAATRTAQAAEESARAKMGQTGIAKSGNRREWLIFLFGWIFNIRSK